MGRNLKSSIPHIARYVGTPFPIALRIPFLTVVRAKTGRIETILPSVSGHSGSISTGKIYREEFPDDILSNEIRRLKTDRSFVPRLQECLFHAIDYQYRECRDLDVVVPVMRGSGGGGYNPPALLAKGVASRYGIPYQDALYKRKVYRPMHSIPDHREKEREIAGKIGCQHRFNGESILLIDDTCITGATKQECATVLRAHGAGEVWSLVLGRMVNRKHLEILRRYNE